MLGIIDWGIGGISIHKLIKQRQPDVGVLYFSDTGATPYGKMGRRELADRLDTVIEFLIAKGMTRLVIGCNSASTVIPDLRDHDARIDGVIEPAVGAASKLEPEDLAVIGGRRTILSGVYRKAFLKRGISIRQRIAQPLSGLIESGDTSSDKLRAEAKNILRPLRDCSHILLACTHYPAIESVLTDYVSIETKFIDPAAAVVEKLGSPTKTGGSSDSFFTTGDPQQMRRSAKLAFEVDIQGVTSIRL